MASRLGLRSPAWRVLTLLSVPLGVLAATAAPVPPPGIAVAPPPRVWKPDATLLVVEWLPKSGEENRYQLVRVDFRNGVARPMEVAWEGEDRVLGHYGGHEVLANRYLVTRSGCVIDIHTKKLISEGFGDFAGVDGLKVFHKMQADGHEKGMYEFDIKAGTLTRLGDVPPARWCETRTSSEILSPNGEKAIRGGGDGELILHQEGKEAKSLGKGFKDEPDPQLRFIQSIDFGPRYAYWLDDHLLITQRANGKLVTLTLDGTVKELVTIKEAQKQGYAGFTRECDGRLVYTVDGSSFVIDVNAKKWEKSDWQFIGDEFEASRWDGQNKGTKIRYRGKEIGELECVWRLGKITPGYIAFAAEVPPSGQQLRQLNCVMVWSAASGDWTMLKFSNMPLNPVVGWIK